MAFFLFLGFVILWVYGWIGFSKRFFEKRQSVGKLTRIAFTTALCIAPFAHELYVYFGFKAYCGVYGGIVQLEPVQTDSLAFDQRIVNEYKLLAHPTIKHVEYVGSGQTTEATSISLTKDTSACRSEFHQGRANDKFHHNRELTQAMENLGFCYTNQTLTTEPRYLLTRDPEVKFLFRPSKSFLYPKLIGSGANIVVKDRLEDKVKSRFVTLVTKPGYLIQILIPQMQQYKCPSLSTSDNSAKYPFNQKIYKFLQQAIRADTQ